MSADISIEPATDEERGYALDCFYRTYLETRIPEDGPPRSREELRKSSEPFLGPQFRSGLSLRLLGRSEDPPHVVFIAKDGSGERAGCLVMRINIESGLRVAWVYLIFVEPWARRHGIGKAMVAKAEEWGRAHGGAFLMLNVDASNEAGLHLYESLGMRPHNIWMRKRL